MHPVVSRALVGAVGCALTVGALALARCPQLVAFVPAEPKVAVETAHMVPAESQGGDTVAATQTDEMAASHFRAVNAMAIMPRTKQRGGTHCRANFDKAGADKTGSRTNEPKFRQTIRQESGEYKQTLVSAKQNVGSDAPGRPVKSGAAVPQELIVLTALEQIQSEGDVLGDRVMPDYGAGTNGRPVDGGKGRVTVTRLIFKVYARATAGASESDGPGGSVVPAEQKQPTSIPTSATAPSTNAQTADSTSNAAGNGVKPANQTAPRGSSSLTNSQTGQPHAVALGNGWFVIQL
jgi:hypothetical protein